MQSSTADYGNIDDRGPLCYVGIFGNNNPSTYAKLMGSFLITI